MFGFGMKKLVAFAGGVLFGTAGMKILASRDAKKVYTEATAAVLRAKDCVMETADRVRENADDILADALEQAVSVLDSDKETGSVLFNLVKFDESGETPYPMRTDKNEWSGQEAFELSLDWSIHGLYVSRTELFRRFPYDDTCRLFSDDNTTRLHYLNSGKVRICQGVYYYRQHGESMTNGITVRRLDLLEANTSMARQLRDAGQERRVLAMFERERWINLTGINAFLIRVCPIGAFKRCFFCQCSV